MSKRKYSQHPNIERQKVADEQREINKQNKQIRGKPLTWWFKPDQVY